MNQLQTYLQACFHISSAVLKFDDVTMQSNPQMLLFLILIMQVAIKILFSQCKVPIELTHFGVMKRSCDPSLRKNVFDRVGVPALQSASLSQPSSSPLNLIAIINTTSCASSVLLSSFAVSLCSLISVVIVYRRDGEMFQDFNQEVKHAKEKKPIGTFELPR